MASMKENAVVLEAAAVQMREAEDAIASLREQAVADAQEIKRLRQASQPPAPPDRDETIEGADMVHSFETSPTEGGKYAIQAKAPGRVSLVNVARHGAKGVRLFAENGDVNISGSGSGKRCDLRLSVEHSGDIREGVEQWWAHSIFLPDDFTMPPTNAWNSCMVADFHHTGGNGQANYGLTVKCLGAGQPVRWIYDIYGGTQDAHRTSGKVFGDTPVQKNTWYDFVYFIRWSSRNDGRFQLYARIEGEPSYKLRLDRANLPTLYSGMQAYWKLANYFGYPGSNAVIHDRVVRGKSSQSVAMAPLED